MTCCICRGAPHVAISSQPLCRTCAHRVIDQEADREALREALKERARREVAASPPRVRSLSSLAAAAA
jgi:hypothetical protein